MTDRPGGSLDGQVLMGGLLMVVVDVDPAHEDEFNRWYDEEHLAEKRATPGFRSARRFVSADQPGKYLALYEIDHPDVVTNPEYMTQTLSERSRAVMATWRAVDRTVWSELPGPASGEPVAEGRPR